MELDIQLIIDLLEEVDELLSGLENYVCPESDICEFTKMARDKISEITEILKASENSKIIKFAVKLYNYWNTKKGVS